MKKNEYVAHNTCRSTQLTRNLEQKILSQELTLSSSQIAVLEFDDGQQVRASLTNHNPSIRVNNLEANQLSQPHNTIHNDSQVENGINIQARNPGNSNIGIEHNESLRDNTIAMSNVVETNDLTRASAASGEFQDSSAVVTPNRDFLPTNLNDLVRDCNSINDIFTDSSAFVTPNFVETNNLSGVADVSDELQDSRAVVMLDFDLLSTTTALGGSDDSSAFVTPNFVETNNLSRVADVSDELQDSGVVVMPNFDLLSTTTALGGLQDSGAVETNNLSSAAVMSDSQNFRAVGMPNFDLLSTTTVSDGSQEFTRNSQARYPGNTYISIEHNELISAIDNFVEVVRDFDNIAVEANTLSSAASVSGEFQDSRVDDMSDFVDNNDYVPIGQLPTHTSNSTLFNDNEGSLATLLDNNESMVVLLGEVNDYNSVAQLSSYTS